MKFRIINRTAMTRKEILMSVAKWVLYSLVLVLSYTIQVTMPFAVWATVSDAHGCGIGFVF